jgi:hypothetical protein
MSGKKQAHGVKRASDRRLLREIRRLDVLRTRNEFIKQLDEELKRAPEPPVVVAAPKRPSEPPSELEPELANLSDQDEGEPEENELVDSEDVSENSDSSSSSDSPEPEPEPEESISEGEEADEPTTQPEPVAKRAKKDGESAQMTRLLHEGGRGKRKAAPKGPAKPLAPRRPLYCQPARASCATEEEAALQVLPEHQYDPNEPLVLPHPRRWIACQRCNQLMRSDQVGAKRITLGVTSYFHVSCV